MPITGNPDKVTARFAPQATRSPIELALIQQFRKKSEIVGSNELPRRKRTGVSKIATS